MELIKLNDYQWQLPKTGQMRVPGIIYTHESGLDAIYNDDALKQVANVAHLPGIVKAAMAMPDIHLGYGFPIGGVAAFDWKDGVVSPGGVGYDINCGVRLSGTRLTAEEIRPFLDVLVQALFRDIPLGVGGAGLVQLRTSQEKKVLTQGAAWAVNHGLGSPVDLEKTEHNGCMAGADPKALSQRALERGKNQLGSLGSGNHFLEIGRVDEIYHPKAAQVFGLFKDQVTVMLHTGSRGLGYQVCDDHLKMMKKISQREKVALPDRQLACAPIQSALGEQYLSAMACAANYAWANRQVLMDRARQTLMETLSISPASLGMSQVYDVCHNIARKEHHTVGNTQQALCVHRKGATRSFGPGHPSIARIYRSMGQPIIIPGDMGTASYVLLGTQKAMAQSFGSTCHGAGRVLSRKAAKKAARGRDIQAELFQKGIHVRWRGRSTLAEEMPGAYKDISQVVETVQGAGLSEKVARIRPLCVIKG